MVTLNIEKFNPKKLDVITLVENIKNTVISIPNNNFGYALMRENKVILQKKRKELTDLFKEERAGALAFQKSIIAIEKDLIGIIEPVENELDKKIKAIDEENEKRKRMKVLPERMGKLALIETVATSNELLSMNDNQFLEFFNNKKEEYLEAKERKIQEEAEKKELKRLAEEQKRIDEANRLEIERIAKIKAYEDALQVKIKEDNDKLEDERIKIKKEHDELEAEKKRIADAELENKRLVDLENQKKLAAEKAIADEKIRIENERLANIEKKRIEQEELKKKEKYQKFLIDNKYNDNVDMLDIKEDKIIIWRKIAEFIK